MAGLKVKDAEIESNVQQVVDLNLVVFDRALHPELFRQYASFRVSQSRYYADVWIIGLGHVVTLVSGAHTLTELVAPDSDVVPTRGSITRFRLKGERDLERKTPDGWNYLVSTQVETMEDPLYKSVHHDLVRYAQKRGCFRAYEQWAEGELMPFQLHIDHEARDREFHVHAFHAFPQDRTLVKTQTIIELPE